MKTKNKSFQITESECLAITPRQPEGVPVPHILIGCGYGTSSGTSCATSKYFPPRSRRACEAYFGVCRKGAFY